MDGHGHDQAAWSKHLHGYIRVYLIESSLEIVGFPSLVFHLVYGFLYFLVSLLLTWKLLFLSRISKTWRKFRWFFHVLNIQFSDFFVTKIQNRYQKLKISNGRWVIKIPLCELLLRWVQLRQLQAVRTRSLKVFTLSESLLAIKNHHFHWYVMILSLVFGQVISWAPKSTWMSDPCDC